MDRHPQQIKRERQDLKRRQRNIQNMSKLKTMMKKVLSFQKGDEVEAPYREAISFIDKMASINLIHKNNAARKKAQLTRHINSL
ncbi:MAG: 30S ribosomal protein S20 [Fidelibacterota bacterium]